MKWMCFLGAWPLIILISGCSVNSKNAYLSKATLESGKWMLINLNGEEIIKQDAEHPVYLEFNVTDQKVTGFAGCNRLFGAYNIEGNTVSFARISSTKTTCPDIATETAFMGNLQRVNRYQIENEKLLLFEKTNLLATMRLLTD